MSLFQECWDRIARADAHGNAFIDICTKFLRSEPYELVTEMRDDGNGVVKAIPRREIDDSLAFELGEFFYQLRAALDTVMWKAFEKLGGSDSTPYASYLYFPILENPKTFKDAAFHKVDLPDKLKVWLRSIQPCHAAERANGSDEAAISEALLIVNNCAKKDRHRHLHVIGAFVTNSTHLVEVTPPAIITYSNVMPVDFFDNQFVIAEFGIEGRTADTKIRAEGGFSIQISIQEIPPEPGADVSVQMWHLSNVVKLVIQTFEEAFA